MARFHALTTPYTQTAVRFNKVQGVSHNIVLHPLKYISRSMEDAWSKTCGRE
jgi:hypothetical protein